MSRRHRVETINYFGPESRHRYFEELKDVLTHCLETNETRPFRFFCARWFKKGAPIDPQVIGCPEPSLQLLLRQVATAIPTLPSHIRADARIWLSGPEFRKVRNPVTGTWDYPKGLRTSVRYVRPYEEAFVPYNLTLYAPNETPYHEYNKKGLTIETTED